ncbi:cytochrome b/b6 domain-containing protein [Nocardia sp. NPDC059240]|uniref:cytochrome b/b6 domain-containing protein n=1 Tax=Nocardia sp. NPDC059240 TaxID=3346786 RepID=UPI0036BC0709
MTGIDSTGIRPHSVRRFSKAERLVHRTTAILMLLCVTTAAFLYIGPLAQLVGQRNLVATVHEFSGVLLPVPVLLGLFSPAFRADLGSLNRSSGKFNVGQQLYAGWIAGTVLVMLCTGLLMWFIHLLPAISRTSAIFVHDVLAWAIVAVLLGHIRKASEDPEARRGMRTGYVDRSWADRQHPRWLTGPPNR